ncbi:DASH family cryptochrome [Ectobacillus ponti]|uniref:Cryptochrome DASH n=1 Tax=Ectobacillus ponti TaxID=2961894 RepID=A0AA41XAD9_9BACI|nr:DASH family cryptochrome [Ectobacillus ponti]MCP8970098.1 DASH family cryptochrome [Ectobacillus ponti]
MDCTIVWFRRDLRVHDHEPLLQAAASGLPVLGLYCFDTRDDETTSFGFSKTGPHRARFIRESVADLRGKLKELGTKLLIRSGKPEDVLAELARNLSVHAVYYHRELGSEEEEVERRMQKACPGISFHAYTGHNLIHPDDLPFPIAELPDVFSQFRKRVEQQLSVRPLQPAPAQLNTLDVEEGELPPAPAVPGKTAFLGGESEGMHRLQHYFFDIDGLRTYKDTRDGMLERDHSSKFSPYLALGCLSPRYIYWNIKRCEQERVANESTYWLFFELLWRDYFWLVHAKFGNRLFLPGGLFGLSIAWSRDPGPVQTWVNGETGYPLVDANMKELQQTGWMSNRGRQNVASFLVKNLGVDWRIGAEWFESSLLDYDVSSNYANWCYSAGVGNDSRVFRVFNVTKQGKDYDPSGRYAKKWLPVLEHVPGRLVYEVPSFSEAERVEHGIETYPRPMVNLFSSAETQKQKYEMAVRQAKSGEQKRRETARKKPKREKRGSWEDDY